VTVRIRGQSTEPRTASPAMEDLRPEPQGDVCRLHALADNARQLGSQAVEVDLVTHLRREVGNRLLRVVLVPKEALVDEGLHARRAGRNAAATPRVEAATTRSFSPGQDEGSGEGASHCGWTPKSTIERPAPAWMSLKVRGVAADQYRRR
jgi:hypothetical protein